MLKTGGVLPLHLLETELHEPLRLLEVGDDLELESVDPSLDKEALRLVNAMPKWNPGKKNGVPVNVEFTLPITFRLQ